MNREQLTKEALSAVCSCWFWSLAGDPDSLTDDELRDIIDTNGLCCHYQAGIADNLSVGDFLDELVDCESYKELVS